MKKRKRVDWISERWYGMPARSCMPLPTLSEAAEADFKCVLLEICCQHSVRLEKDIFIGYHELRRG